RDVSISARLPRGDPLHRLPYGNAVARPGKLERQVELEFRIVEIRLELDAREMRDRIAFRHQGRRGGREETDARHVLVGGVDAERGEGRANASLERRFRHWPRLPRARESSRGAPRG